MQILDQIAIEKAVATERTIYQIETTFAVFTADEAQLIEPRHLDRLAAAMDSLAMAAAKVAGDVRAARDAHAAQPAPAGGDRFALAPVRYAGGVAVWGADGIRVWSDSRDRDRGVEHDSFVSANEFPAADVLNAPPARRRGLWVSYAEGLIDLSQECV